MRTLKNKKILPVIIILLIAVTAGYFYMNSSNTSTEDSEDLFSNQEMLLELEENAKSLSGLIENINEEEIAPSALGLNLAVNWNGSGDVQQDFDNYKKILDKANVPAINNDIAKVASSLESLKPILVKYSEYSNYVNKLIQVETINDFNLIIPPQEFQDFHNDLALTGTSSTFRVDIAEIDKIKQSFKPIEIDILITDINNLENGIERIMIFGRENNYIVDEISPTSEESEVNKVDNNFPLILDEISAKFDYENKVISCKSSINSKIIANKKIASGVLNDGISNNWSCSLYLPKEKILFSIKVVDEEISSVILGEITPLIGPMYESMAEISLEDLNIQENIGNYINLAEREGFSSTASFDIEIMGVSRFRYDDRSVLTLIQENNTYYFIDLVTGEFIEKVDLN